MTTIERLLTRWRLSTIGYFAVLFKRIPLAIDTYRQLVALAPRDRVLRSALGNLYSEAGDLEAAVQEFEQLTALAPSDADAWFNLGFLHDKRDELEPAERCFRRAAGQKPTLDRAWYGLGLVLV